MIKLKNIKIITVLFLILLFLGIYEKINYKQAEVVCDSSSVVCGKLLKEVRPDGSYRVFKNYHGGNTNLPDMWSLFGAGAAVKSQEKTGSDGQFSLKLTSQDEQEAVLYNSNLEEPYWLNYADKKDLSFNCWVYADNPNRVRIAIRDDAGFSVSKYHSGNSTWQLLSVSRKMDSSRMAVVYLRIEPGSPVTAYYYDPKLTPLELGSQTGLTEGNSFQDRELQNAILNANFLHWPIAGENLPKTIIEYSKDKEMIAVNKYYSDGVLYQTTKADNSIYFYYDSGSVRSQVFVDGRTNYFKEGKLFNQDYSKYGKLDKDDSSFARSSFGAESLCYRVSGCLKIKIMPDGRRYQYGLY